MKEGKERDYIKLSSAGNDNYVDLVNEDDPDQLEQQNEEFDEYETEDDEVKDEIDEYLQNKGCKSIVSATSTVRPKRVLIVVNRTEENMLTAMREYIENNQRIY